MNRYVLSCLAFAMALGTAQAEPLTLSADQMDKVTAAGFGFVQFDAFLNRGNRRFFAGSADDPFFFDIPGFARFGPAQPNTQRGGFQDVFVFGRFAAEGDPLD